MKAFVFPGQGSQTVGMGKELYRDFSSAREVFQEINEAIDKDLTKIMFEGPQEELVLTENAQVALMSVSMAILRVMEKEFDFDIKKEVAYVAGHSVGEYSAIAATNALDIASIAKLLKVRGRAMFAASPAGFGAMAAIIGINDIAIIQQLINETKEVNEICVIANDNSVGQTVISGNMRSIDNAIAKAKDYGAMKAIKLPVSGSFHSPLMQKVSETLAEELNDINFKDASIPIISNTLAKEVVNGDDIKALLVEQVVNGVRWRESMVYLAQQGVNEIVEIGQGSVLTGLMKRIDKNVARFNIQEKDSIEKFMNKLK